MENENNVNANDQMLINSGFTPDQIKAMKEQANAKIENDRKQAHLSTQHGEFDTVFNTLISDPNLTGMKDTLESVLKDNSKFKDLGSAGVEVLLSMAKKENELNELKNKPNGTQIAVDNLNGSANAPSNTLNSNDSVLMENNPDIIDFTKVKTEGLSRAQMDFVEIQRLRQARKKLNN